MTDPVPDYTGRDGRLELSAPATPEILELVHAMMAHLWTTHEVTAQQRVRFETSVIEILGNIVEHALVGSAPGDGRRFDIVLDVGRDDVVARLGDNGIPVEMDLSKATMPDELAEDGRGLALAKAALDSLSYRRIDGRNLWDLVVLRGGS
ncbi:ATP-binding protein [Nocardioides rubriscoriae]|uniref:ATP-binding protein n=1 Tax=Nocardioides rubriscoriae TaxID=642762 RepID=UPI0011DFD7FC|nr:ATP-binding protein [Nocardioides rubriscoriae]